MKKERFYYSLSSPPEWLLKHQDYTPWTEGQQKIQAQIKHWNQDYGLCVNDHPEQALPPSDEERLSKRLLTCWIYHWVSAGKTSNGEDVARNVENGRGYARGGRLGGNPFFDLVLSEALCAQQNKAFEFFETLYGHYLRTTAGKANWKWIVSEDETPEWWSPFYIHLTSFSDSTAPALDSFMGYSALKGWLCTALGHFLCKFRRTRRQELLFTDMERGEENDENDFSFEAIIEKRGVLMTFEQYKEMEEHLIAALQAAKNSLDPEDWSRIFLFYGKKAQNQEIASLYKEDDSVTSRRRMVVLEQFRNALWNFLAADPVLAELKDGWLASADSAAILSEFMKKEV